MADQPAQPTRWVIIKQFEHAVERTLAEVEELIAHGLYVRDASGPEDRQNPPVPVAVPQIPPPGAAATPNATTTPPGGKEKTQ